MVLDPENFSWIKEGVLAGSSFPRTSNHFQFYRDQNIEVIINLTENATYPVDASELRGFRLFNIPVVDFHPPTIKQLIEFNNIVQNCKAKGKAAVVHCYAGCGRTGTFLASWYIANFEINGNEAIEKIRSMRPCSIETMEQESIVREFDIKMREK